MASFNLLSYKLEDIDDGHCPGATNVQTKLANYVNKQSFDFLNVYDNVLTDEWCNIVYEYAVQKNKPWGSYITTEDALNSHLIPEELWKKGEFEKAIALVGVRSLIFDKGKSSVGDDLQNIHGTAVWCLSSGLSNSVSYHIDYAELYRYENNVIHPPLYAGTCQVSPLNCSKEDDEHCALMSGGDFQANFRGLDHYRQFGYKSRLVTAEQVEQDSTSADWVTVKYKRNRGIFHDGNFPHQSTPVTALPLQGIRRVILGFNCFTAELGECCVRAPEHSDAFNRTVKLYQAMSAAGLPVTAAAAAEGKYEATPQLPSPREQKATRQGGDVKAKGGVTAKDLLSNPALGRLLVLAARRVRAAAAVEQPPASS